MKKMRWLGLMAALTIGCTDLFLYPDQEMRRTPNDVGLEFEAVSIPTTDDLTLAAWYLPARGQPWANLLLAHGNAENISTHLASVYWMPAQGIHVLLFDYRGFGQSEGYQSVEGAQEDFKAALDYLLKRSNGLPVITFGQSFGGATTVYSVATSHQKNQVALVVIEGAFSDYRAMAREAVGRVWFLSLLRWPLSLTVSDAFDPVDVVAQIAPTPLLVMHSEADQVVPVKFGRELFAAAGEPRELWLDPTASHISILITEQNRRRFVETCQRLIHQQPLP